MASELISLRSPIRYSLLAIVERHIEDVTKAAKRGTPPADRIAEAVQAALGRRKEEEVGAVEDALAEYLLRHGLFPTGQKPAMLAGDVLWRRDVFSTARKIRAHRLEEAQAMLSAGLAPDRLFDDLIFTLHGHERPGLAVAVQAAIAPMLAGLSPPELGSDFAGIHSSELVQARKLIADDQAPIIAFAGLIDGRPARWRSAWVKAIEERLEPILLGEGYVACADILHRSASEGSEGRRYFRPAHAALFDRIEAGDPLIIVSTREARRIAREVINAYGPLGARRPTFIWSIGSGLFELTADDGHQRFREVNDVAVGVEIQPRLGYEPALDETASAEERRAVVAALKHDGFEEIEVGAKASPHWTVSRAEEGQGGQTAWRIERIRTASALRAWWRLGRLGKEEVYAVDIVTGCQDPTEELLDSIAEEVRRLTVEKLKRSGAGVQHYPRGDESLVNPAALAMLMRTIATHKLPDALYILHDAQQFLDSGARGHPLSGVTASTIRDAAIRLRRGGSGTQIVLFTGNLLPIPELEDDVPHVDIALPTRGELSSVLSRRFETALSDDEDGDTLRRLTDSAAGMTLSQVIAAIRPMTERPASAETLLDAIGGAKKVAIKRSGALELVSTAHDVSLGGMEKFQHWLEQRRKVLDRPAAAAAAGIARPPRGVLLVGIPGSGKSLAAKEVARQWKLPLLRMDLGSIQGKWVGDSERNMREALKAVEAISPCVLWIDEIEKGISTDVYEHRASLNTRATLLTWLQESLAPAFVVATANRMNRLPPELTRAGRFDARFFFGCPSPPGLRKILDIHLAARGLSIEGDLEELVAAMRGFTGAEVEQGVLNACYRAFAKGEPVALDDVHAEVAEIKPIIASFGKELEEVWDLIEHRRVLPASKHMLGRMDVLKLTDPNVFSPMYCRNERIEGWEKLASTAARMLMEDPSPGRTAIMLATGDTDWMYVQANFPFAQGDASNWKFVDRKETVAANGALNMLVTQFGVDTIRFDSKETFESFKGDERFAAYAELFVEPGEAWIADTADVYSDSWT